jgi:hypothetical protein
MHSDQSAKGIVAALRKAGATVEYINANYGRAGVPDLIVGVNGTTYLMECKTGKAKLSDKQEAWHRAWKGGPLVTVSTAEAALAAVGLG